MKFARNFIVFFALFSLVNFSFCEEDVFFVDDLKFYYQGKTDFEELNYGSALKKLNAAKTERIKKNQNEIRILENALKPHAKAPRFPLDALRYNQSPKHILYWLWY